MASAAKSKKPPTVIMYGSNARKISARMIPPVCGHNAMLKFADLPDWTWQDISAHLKCTKCGAVGYVDTRVNWSEVIDFNKGICS
jgi:hypothetical protein